MKIKKLQTNTTNSGQLLRSTGTIDNVQTKSNNGLYQYKYLNTQVDQLTITTTISKSSKLVCMYYFMQLSLS